MASTNDNNEIINNTDKEEKENDNNILYNPTSVFSSLSPPIDIIFDMETADPDDFFTLCFLLSHPHSCLRAVTLYPGSLAQVGLIKHTLKFLGRPDIVVGSFNPNHPKSSVSPFHYKLFAEEIKEEKPDGLGYEIMYSILQKFPSAVIFTGGPPFNFSKLISEYDDVVVQKWFAQVLGGFAGQNVVAPEHILKKFQNLDFCASANFGNDLSISSLLSSSKIKQRILVSKNVCHKVKYGNTIHKQIKNIQNKTKGLELLCQGMEIYLEKHVEGKKFHDPLACSVIFDKEICEYREVEMKYTKVKGWGAWGCELKNGTNTWISVSVNIPRFWETLTRM